MRQAASGLEEQLNGVIEVRRVAAIGGDDGVQFLHVVAKKRRLQKGLAGLHPVHISAKRVDLSVMGDISVRMGTLPTRKSVGGEALVDEAQRANRVGIREFAIKAGNLRGE